MGSLCNENPLRAKVMNMKALQRIVVASVVLAVLLAPLALLADQLPAPLEKKITPGVTTIAYAGQNLRFTTDVALVIRFDAMSATQIKLTVKAYGSTSPSAASGTTDLNIYWENFNTDIYTGPAPPSSQPWEGVLNSESGFTEK